MGFVDAMNVTVWLIHAFVPVKYTCTRIDAPSSVMWNMYRYAWETISSTIKMARMATGSQLVSWVVVHGIQQSAGFIVWAPSRRGMAKSSHPYDWVDKQRGTNIAFESTLLRSFLIVIINDGSLRSSGSRFGRGKILETNWERRKDKKWI